MSSSPFEIFRRNLKPLMVLLTGLAMFAFVVLPVLDTYMRRGASTGGDQVVAEFDGIKLTSSRVDYFTRNHNATVRFLRELAQATIDRGGSPQTAGFQYDVQAGRIDSIGINEAPSPESSVRTLQFANQATEAGFALDDVAIQTWLQQFTDGMFSDSEINGMLMQSTRNQMGQYHLYDQLRTQLLADLYLRGAFATLLDGRMPLLTPAEQWDTFLKLNREATVDAYGVLVNDFLSQTNSSPGQQEIAAIYELGKERDPSDQSPDPAFHRRYTAKFEYLVGDYQTLLKEEVAKLTDEQLRAEYERQLKGGAFQLPDNASDDILKQMEAARAADEARKAAAAKANEPAAEPAEEAEASTGSQPAAQEPAAERTEAGSQPQASEPNTGEPVTSNDSSTESSAAPPAEGDAAEGAVETPNSEDQSRIDERDLAVRLVAFQNDDPPAENSPPAAAPEESPAAAPEESPAATPDQAASATPEETPAATPEETSAATPDEASAGSDTQADAAVETPSVEAFEDVRDRIAEELAGPLARRRLDTAVQELTNKMRRYFSERAIYESNLSIGQDVQPPKPLDLKALGQEFGFQYEMIGPYNEVSIGEEPIAQSREVGSEGMSRGPGFAMMMFGYAGGMPPIPAQPLYAPLRTADDQSGKRYVSWKIAETQARTPPLEEVRDEVIMYIRMQEARKLALARAEELAEKATDSDTPLADLIPADKKANLQAGLGPFSWLDQLGFQGATIGNVPQLDSVGPDFMKAVFNSQVGQYAVAMNQPQRVAYVVKPTSFEPSIDELRRRFKEPTGRMMATFIGGSENNSVIQGFYKAIDEETGYTSAVQQ